MNADNVMVSHPEAYEMETFNNPYSEYYKLLLIINKLPICQRKDKKLQTNLPEIQ
jgi:hypothetical protein